MTTDSKDTPAAPAVGIPVQRPVGRPVEQATNACGPAGTYGCACLDRDSVQCGAIRYGMDHWGERCGCLCHQWSYEDDDLG